MESGIQAATSLARFRWLRTVDESMEAMLGALQQATTSVRLEMYIYTDSAVGERFRDALVKAAKRKVAVRVLIDSWGSFRLGEKFWQPLHEVGGKVRWFNPLSLGRCGIRDHRKLLVCDDAIAFIGGFNISSEYQGDGVTRGWYDLGLRVEGALAQALAISFDKLFGLADFKHRRFARFRRSAEQSIVPTADGQLLLGGPGYRPSALKTLLLNDLASSKSIRIIAGYFLPARPIRRALTRAARRGSRVQIILAAKSDVPMILTAFRRFYQSFLRAGIELYEYQPQVLHAKLVVADEVVYVGSANLDRRSFLANYELMLRLTRAGLASEAEAIFNETLSHSRRIDREKWKKSRSLWGKLMEWWAFLILARIDACVSRRQLKNLR